VTTPSADQLAQATALIEAQATTRQAISDQAVAIVTGAVRGFDQWWDSRAISDLVARIRQALQPRQRIMAGQTDAYLARMLTILSDRLVQPVGPIAVENLRRGTTMEDAYGRLADQYRWLISEGRSEDQALQSVLTRAEVMADTDISLAMRDQSQEFMVHKVETGYRRVIHPELPGKVCGLCIIASDRVYKKKDLLPLHGRCKCTVVPIYNGIDLGGHLNADDLTALYEAAGGNTRNQLKRVQISIHDHGELGPVLTDRADRFRGPRDVAA
jgi:hypothetical protein